MLTACVTTELTLSESLAVKVAVPEKPAVRVTVYVTLEVPCPAVTATFETPVPAVADQLKMLLSSEPVRPTVNGAAFCATVVIGFAGALMEGGLFEGWMTVTVAVLLSAVPALLVTRTQ